MVACAGIESATATGTSLVIATVVVGAVTGDSRSCDSTGSTAGDETTTRTADCSDDVCVGGTESATATATSGSRHDVIQGCCSTSSSNCVAAASATSSPARKPVPPVPPTAPTLVVAFTTPPAPRTPPAAVRVMAGLPVPTIDESPPVTPTLPTVVFVETPVPPVPPAPHVMVSPSLNPDAGYSA
jgi:hypothetical protein